ncbi:MAG TPA: hypothetical protein VKA70_06590 [Blastocatellia bacterium]|nr:hypothetical protein [Blastocatellia bacterium]
MICWRVDIKRDFSRYLHGELDRARAGRVEDHVLDCLICRAHLARIRDGHRFAEQTPRLRPERDVWSAIEAAIQSDGLHAQHPAAGRAIASPFWRAPSFNRRLAAAVAVIALIAVGLIVALDRREAGEMAWPAIAERFDEKEFHEVSISNISTNTKPHVVAEGFVSEVRIDRDGDLTFRLVEDLEQGEPFIVCEIIEPIRLEAPSVGSRVRVYGVSRYDDQENHRWHEVHPVLNIENIPR